jgi:hypothetical protein
VAGHFVSLALGCSACALRENTPGRMLILVGMILLPWTVVGASIWAIRKMAKQETLAREQEG